MAPSFIANRNTDENEELVINESKLYKKQKKNNIDSIAIAIVTMNETKEKVQEKRIELEREKWKRIIQLK